jgi:hypothetical protein
LTSVDPQQKREHKSKLLGITVKAEMQICSTSAITEKSLDRLCIAAMQPAQRVPPERGAALA